MIRIAILGAGFMGATHAAGWQALGRRARVTTVCARTAVHGRAVAQAVGAAFSTDLDSVLADPDIDAVDICLPTPLHRSATERALGAGKHVLLEKPIALTLADAEAIARTAAKSDRIFMVALVLRFFAEYAEIARRVRAGELGKPLAASAYRLSAPADWNTWMLDPAQSGGTLVDDLVHDFDQMNVLFGSARRVLARTAPGQPGHVHAIVSYEAGEALVEGSAAMPASFGFSAGIRVLCERGSIEHVFRSAPEGDGNIGIDSERSLRVHGASAEPEAVEVPAADPWASEIAYFARCIESNRLPELGTAEQACAALRVSLAAVRSVESGQIEPV